MKLSLKKVLQATVACCVCLCIGACELEQSEVPVTGVTLNTEVLELLEGETEVLQAIVSPSNATNKKVLWISSNSSVVTVADGVVNALKKGTANITAKTDDGGLVANCEVIVKSEEVENDNENSEVSFGPASISVSKVTATTATVKIHLDIPALDMSFSKVTLYYSDTELFNLNNAQVLSETEFDINQDFVLSLTNLDYDTKYNFVAYIKIKDEEIYSDILSFKTNNIIFDLPTVVPTARTVKFSGMLSGLSAEDLSVINVGVMCGYDLERVENKSAQRTSVTIEDDYSVNLTLKYLDFNKKYYYRSYIKYGGTYIYGDVMEFSTAAIDVSISVDKSSVTAFRAMLVGKVTGISVGDLADVRILYSTNLGALTNIYWAKDIENYSEDRTFEFPLYNLIPGTKYYYKYVIAVYDSINSQKYYAGDVHEFSTETINVTLSVDESSITGETVTVCGKVHGLASDEYESIEIGIGCSAYEDEVQYDQNKHVVQNISTDGEFTFIMKNLVPGTKYYYCSCVHDKINNLLAWGDKYCFTTKDVYAGAVRNLDMSYAEDLSVNGSANSYIVSERGLYKIKTVKGNSDIVINDISSPAILWETFGTSVRPECCEIISAVSYKDGYLAFQTSDTFKEGNAVIAVKDAAGNILWSWHIWLTDLPQSHVYYNNAGVLMDRNLGATSSTPGDVGALGLIYRHGRKDPFLCSSSIKENILAESTTAWPKESMEGDAVANPTTYKINNPIDGWGVTKTISDPCPPGWRVPRDNLFAIASNEYREITTCQYDQVNCGYNFSGIFGNDSLIWYPSAGWYDQYGDYYGPFYGNYFDVYLYGLNFNSDNYVYFDRGTNDGATVRCQKE